ncbi:MAG: hypothetical protein ABJA76_11620 [Mucilaginibacter sp.]
MLDLNFKYRNYLVEAGSRLFSRRPLTCADRLNPFRVSLGFYKILTLKGSNTPTQGTALR